MIVPKSCQYKGRRSEGVKAGGVGESSSLRNTAATLTHRNRSPFGKAGAGQRV